MSAVGSVIHLSLFTRENMINYSRDILEFQNIYFFINGEMKDIQDIFFFQTGILYPISHFICYRLLYIIALVITSFKEKLFNNKLIYKLF